MAVLLLAERKGTADTARAFFKHASGNARLGSGGGCAGPCKPCQKNGASAAGDRQAGQIAASLDASTILQAAQGLCPGTSSLTWRLFSAVI